MEGFVNKRAPHSATRILVSQPSITVGLLPRRCSPLAARRAACPRSLTAEVDDLPHGLALCQAIKPEVNFIESQRVRT
jgi:hypothetical protein